MTEEIQKAKNKAHQMLEEKDREEQIWKKRAQAMKSALLAAHPDLEVEQLWNSDPATPFDVQEPRDEK